MLVDGPLTLTDPASLGLHCNATFGSRPMQPSDERDSELTCVQLDQRMHGPEFGYLPAESYENVRVEPTVIYL